MSDDTAHGFGLERIATPIDGDQRRLSATLLPHEYAHSWNGKYRRPVGLATGNCSTPYNNELLWVYEGLTTYLGALLTARSGLQTPEEFRDDLARTAAFLDARPGRTWRPLQDTADEAQLLYGARADYAAWRRSAWDFYVEGMLLWLEVDVTIRDLTAGAKSLDGFCRAFYGGESGPPTVKLYTLDDVVATLDRVAPHDWRALLAERLQSVRPDAPLHGIEQAGWRLVFRDAPTSMFGAAETVNKQTDARSSLGLLIGADGDDSGVLVDVIPGTPAAQAGLAPGMTLRAVTGRRFPAEILKAALKESIISTDPLQLLIENRGFFSTHNVDYHGGERYPWLERDSARPDLLTGIISPLMPAQQ